MLRANRSRRGLLRGASALAGTAAVGALAGCTGIENDVGKRGLSVVRVDSGTREAAPDRISVDAHVRNRWIASVDATLVCAVTFQDGAASQKRQPITVAAGATERYEFTFDAAHGDPNGPRGFRPSVALA